MKSLTEPVLPLNFGFKTDWFSQPVRMELLTLLGVLPLQRYFVTDSYELGIGPYKRFWFNKPCCCNKGPKCKGQCKSRI